MKTDIGMPHLGAGVSVETAPASHLPITLTVAAQGGTVRSNLDLRAARELHATLGAAITVVEAEATT